jgi:hypothetical protein
VVSGSPKIFAIFSTFWNTSKIMVPSNLTTAFGIAAIFEKESMDLFVWI